MNFFMNLDSPKRSQNFIHPPLVTSPIPWGIQRGPRAERQATDLMLPPVLAKDEVKDLLNGQSDFVGESF